MKFEIQFLLFLFLVVVPFVQIGASIPDVSTVLPSTSDVRDTPGLHVKMKKPGLFQQIRAIKAIKKYVKEQGREDEKASKLANIAKILFVSYFALAFLTQIAPFFAYLAGAAFITSIILAIIILFDEDNPKSRRIARLILIISGIMAALGVILVALLLSFLG